MKLWVYYMLKVVRQLLYHLQAYLQAILKLNALDEICIVSIILNDTKIIIIVFYILK